MSKIDANPIIYIDITDYSPFDDVEVIKVVEPPVVIDLTQEDQTTNVRLTLDKCKTVDVNLVSPEAPARDPAKKRSGESGEMADVEKLNPSKRHGKNQPNGSDLTSGKMVSTSAKKSEPRGENCQLKAKHKKVAEKIDVLVAAWYTLSAAEKQKGHYFQPDENEIPNALSKAAQKIRDFGTEDVSMLNQSGIQSYFWCGGQQRNFVAWIIFEIIHNKGKYCLTKTVIHSPNMRTTSDDLIIGPVWKEKVGEYDRWNNSPSPKDLDNEHVFLENLKIAKFVYATALDSKATYDAEVEKNSALKDIAHGNHKTLAKAAKAINNFTRTRVSFLTAKGLVKKLKSVGNLTACRIIHLIKNEGVFEPSTVDWVDLRTKRFSIKHFEGDQ